MILCFFRFSIKACKCSDSCNNINNPCVKLCVPDITKNLNVKVLNLVSGTNEARRIEQHETCKCKCRFKSSVYNNKQRWNDDKFRYKYKELIDKVCPIKDLFGILVIVRGNVINRVILVSIQTIKIVSVKKRLVDKLAEECAEDIDEIRLVEINSTKSTPLKTNAYCTLCYFRYFLQLTLEWESTFFIFIST